MAKELSEERRAIMRKRAQEAKSGGVLISLKGFVRGDYRILPWLSNEDDLGIRLTTLFVKHGPTNKDWWVTTTPEQFDLPCPIMDFRETTYVGGTKEEKQYISGVCQARVEFLLGVIDRDCPGTVEVPRFRVFPAKNTVFQVISACMGDEKAGADITDPVDGTDIVVKRTGSGLDTEWTTIIGSKSTTLIDTPTNEVNDEIRAAIASVAEKAAAFDLSVYEGKCHVPTLRKMYEFLTGQKELPGEYLERYVDAPGMDFSEDKESEGTPSRAVAGMVHGDAQQQAGPSMLQGGARSEKSEASQATAQKAGPSMRQRSSEPEPESETEQDSEAVTLENVTLNETLVSFEVEDEGTLSGVVVEVDQEKKVLVVEVDGNLWDVAPADAVFVPGDAPPEEMVETPEDSPEESTPPPPTPQQRTAPASMPRKPATGTKNAKKRPKKGTVTSRIRGRDVSKKK